eukprot:6659537-Pyramimonas_sp.AAC.2
MPLGDSTDAVASASIADFAGDSCATACSSTGELSASCPARDSICASFTSSSALMMSAAPK